MKVTALTSLYRPHVGGVETMVEEMHHYMREQSHDMDVIAKQWPSDLPEQEDIDGVSVTRIKSTNSEQEMVDLASELRNRGDLLGGTDILHMVGMRRPLPLFGVLLSQVHDKPVVGSVVGSEVPNTNSLDSHRIWSEGVGYMPDAYRNTQMLTAVSESTKNFTLAVLPELADRLSVLPVGIDLKGYESIEPAKLDGIDDFILSMRRLEHSKGVDVLIKAYADLITKSKTNIPLVIAGDGPEKTNLQNLCKQLGLDDSSVRFIGPVSLSESIGLLKSASMTVVPSRAEGGGLINTEANAVGCPLITSDTGGIDEYTTREAAIFTNPEDVDGITQAMLTVLNNKTLRDSMVANGKEFATTRGWDGLIHQYIELYEKVAEAPRTDLHIKSKLGRKILKILSNEA